VSATDSPLWIDPPPVELAAPAGIDAAIKPATANATPTMALALCLIEGLLRS
jgi:hypothetical protein